MLMLLAGTWLVADANADWIRDPVTGRTTFDRPAWVAAVNPLAAWNRLAVAPGGFDAARVAPAAGGVVLFAGLAGLLWWSALRRFEREGRE